MDLIKRMLLVLCISLCGTWPAAAAPGHLVSDGQQAGPARASSSRGAPQPAIVAPPSAKTTLAASATSTITYYGPPYFQYGYSNYGPWGDISSAVAAWWADYKRVYGYAFPGCFYSLELTDPNSTNNPDNALGRVAIMPLSGTCGGWGRVVATAYSFKPGKNDGPPCSCAGDPINLGTGDEYRDDEDTSLGDLSFHRYYHSHASVAPSHMGPHWRHSFDRSLEYLSDGTTSVATVFRQDGLQVVFTLQNGQWTTDPDVADRLTAQTDGTGAITGWLYFDASTRNQEAYNADGTLASMTDTSGQVTTLTYSTTSTPTSIAPSAGLLLTVNDPRGRSLNFTYNAQGNVATATEPDGGVLGYSYDTNGMLVTVTYPDTKTRQYVYNESTLTGGNNLPNALTGDIDESGARFTSIGYNAQGQATMSTLPGGADLSQVVYNSDGTTSVTYPTGSQTTLSFAAPNGSVHASSVSAPCGVDCGQPNAAATFDSNGYVASTTDFNGNVTTMVHDANGLLDQQVDGSGSTDQRTTNATWDTTLRVPLTRTVLDAGGNTVAKTAWVYNTIGQVLARCDIDPTSSAATGYACAASGTVPAGVRRWTYTYCDAVDSTQCPIVGLLLTATGPRTDLAQTAHYSYYMDSATAGCTTPGGACHQPGDLYQVTDPLGHVTTYASYDADGRVTRITDANGVNTDLTYTPRGWLASRSVAGAVTTFGYKPYGAVQSITDPDGVTTTFGYDAAHRLTDITDAQGNYIHYTLDAAGNKTKEEIFDSAGTAHYSQSKTFNTLGQLTTIVDGLSHTVFNANTAGDYDANGNLKHSSDALGVQTQRSYDALNRLVGTIRDYNGTGASTKNSTTTVAYDALDRVTGVSDPDSLVTSYTYDGLGDLTHLQSPDTGLSGGSAGDMFDAAGNLTQHTDARGVVTQYTYDALNRLTGKIYPAHPALNVTYTYDQSTPIAGCPNNDNIGHITTMTDASGSTAWCYTAQGDISQVRQTINSVSYLQSFTYTPGRRLQTQQYPSGFALSYSYDSDGRVATMGYLQNLGPYGSYTNSTVTPLITAVSYLPFGPMSAYSWAQGSQNVLRTYDKNYALTDITGSALNLHFLRDAKSRIAAEGNTAGASPANESYQSDALDRLTQLTDASGAAEQAFSYNLTGDRLSKTVAGQSTLNYGYQSGTHQLTLVGSASRSVDADGNTTAMLTPNGTQVQLVYDDRSLLTQVQSGGNPIANYQYNGQGIRVWRTITAPSTGQAATVYDPLGTGNLYGEYFAADYREYVYLNGIPVASAMDAGRQAPAMSYLYADGLGTVRAATTMAGAVTDQWSWLNNAFGDKAMTGASIYYLRFPGQYYDVETGLHYNGHRYYDPSTGRYVQSDPIGLDGGVSTYAYVGSNPLSHIDPAGLESPRTASGCGTMSWTACSSLPPAIPTPGCNGNGNGGFPPGLLATIIATEIAGGGPEDPLADAAVAEEIVAAETEDAAITAYADSTDPGALVTNITTDATAGEAGATLEGNGFTATTSADGQATIYTNAQGDTYVIRASNSAPNGTAMDFYPGNGSSPVKINFGGPSYQP